jgi:hypothetical protein
MKPTQQLLVSVGETLYGEGESWPIQLATDLGVAERTMRRWLSGESPIPEGVWADVLNVVAGRGKALAELIPKIQAQVG